MEGDWVLEYPAMRSPLDEFIAEGAVRRRPGYKGDLEGCFVSWVLLLPQSEQISSLHFPP